MLSTRKTLEPLDFCRKYSKYTSDEWGYRKQWNALIAKVLDISVETVKGWGDGFKECPERYKRQLDVIDSLMQAEDVLRRHGLNRDNLEK